MSSKTYVVTGPLATPYREDGERVYLYKGAELPDGLREGEAERLVDLGLVEVRDKKAAADPDAKPTTVKAILAAVGDDKEKAQAYLDEENAAEEPRVSLVEKLEAIVDADDGGGGGD